MFAESTTRGKKELVDGMFAEKWRPQGVEKRLLPEEIQCDIGYLLRRLEFLLPDGGEVRGCARIETGRKA